MNRLVEERIDAAVIQAMKLNAVETAFDRTHDLGPHSQNVVQVEVKSLRLKLRSGQRARLRPKVTLRVRTRDNERNVDDLLYSPESAIATDQSRMAAAMAAHVVSVSNA